MLVILLLVLTSWPLYANTQSSGTQEPNTTNPSECSRVEICVCLDRTVNCSANNFTELNMAFYSYFDDFVRASPYRILLVDRNRLTIMPIFPFALRVQLIEANLSHNSIKTIGQNLFFNFIDLEILDLSHNLITGSFVPSYFSTTRLRYLSLSNNQIRRINTSENSVQFRWALTILDLSFNNLSRLSAENINDFPNLQTLRIDHNQLETLDISWFAPAQFLRSLHASGNLITHVTMSGPTAFRNLTLINVAMNKIAQLHTEIFFQLTTLTKLDISFNDLTSINPIENSTNVSRTIFAEGNPWHCSCILTQIYNDLKDNNIILACKTESECLYCETPASFHGILVKNACSAISDHTSLFVIIGGAAAGLVFILLIIIGVLCVLRNRKKASQTEDNRRLENDLSSSHVLPRRLTQAQEDQYCVPSTFPTTQSPSSHHNPQVLKGKASRSVNSRSQEHVYANDAFQTEGEYMVMATEKENPTTDNQASNTTQPPGIPRRTPYQNINHQKSKSNVNLSDVYQKLNNDNVTLNDEPTTPQRAGTVYLTPMN